MKIENKDICRKCGGKCCKKSGCDYSIHDMEDLTLKGLLNALEKEDKSIVAVLNFKRFPNGKLVASPFLYLRARNQDRGIIDLVSMKKSCSQLTSTGCKYDYEQRPYGGRNLVPVKQNHGSCYPLNNPFDNVLEWEPYQKQLRRIVKTYTGLNVNDVVRHDVTELIYDFLCKNFKGIHEIEIKDLQEFVPLLIEAFPDEAQIARKRVNSKATVLKLNNK